LLNRLIRLNRLVAHQNRNNMRLKNISKNLTAKLTVNRINRLLRLKRFGSVRLIGFGYILPTPSWRQQGREDATLFGKSSRTVNGPGCDHGYFLSGPSANLFIHGRVGFACRVGLHREAVLFSREMSLN